jgi:DNA-binding MarR family transcriptional regulator
MDDTKKISNLIVEFYEKLSSWEHAIVADSGVSLPQMHVIEILGIIGSVKMKELADKLGITTGTLTITIDKLEKKGLVERLANPDDRRSYVIQLTGAGKALQKEHSNYHLKMTEECIINYSKNDKKKLISLIESFIENL